MRFLWSTALKDWRRQWRDPLAFLLWLGIPILIGGLITMAAGGRSGPAPKAYVLVVDEDDSFLSGLLVGAMSQDAAGGLIQAENVEREEGHKRVADDKATAMLVIPAGFGQAVLEEKPTTLELITNPAQTILPGIVEEGLSILVDAVFYVHRVIGDDLKKLSAGPPDGASVFPDVDVAEFSVNVNQVMERMGEYLFPPVIAIEAPVAEEADEEEENVSTALLFLPGILFMALLFMAQGLSIDLWRERDNKTLRRVVVSPQPVLLFLTGKLLSSIALLFVVCLVALSIGYAYFSLSVETLPLAVMWSVFSGCLLTVLMMVIMVYSPSERAAGIFSMVLLFPLMMAGGSFFPFEAMPAWMAAIGKFTPNGWALEELKKILLGRAETVSLGTSFIGLLAVIVILFAVSTHRLRSGFARG